MSKGYPTRPPPPPDEGLGELVPEGVCGICKRRPAEGASGFCSICSQRLAT